MVIGMIIEKDGNPFLIIGGLVIACLGLIFFSSDGNVHGVTIDCRFMECFR